MKRGLMTTQVTKKHIYLMSFNCRIANKVDNFYTTNRSHNKRNKIQIKQQMAIRDNNTGNLFVNKKKPV